MGSPQVTCGDATGKEGVRERIGKQKLENRNSGNKRPEAQVKVPVPRFEGKEPARMLALRVRVLEKNHRKLTGELGIASKGGGLLRVAVRN